MNISISDCPPQHRHLFFAQDNLRLELLITLIRNLLAVPDSPQRVLQDLTNLTRSCRTLHDEFLLLLEREHVLTLFLYIAQVLELCVRLFQTHFRSTFRCLCMLSLA